MAWNRRNAWSAGHGIVLFAAFGWGLMLGCEQEEDVCKAIEADIVTFLDENSACTTDADCKSLPVRCYGGRQSQCNVVGVASTADAIDWATLDEQLLDESCVCNFEGECGGTRPICAGNGMCSIARE